jgi:SRSO17 transposase
MELRGRKSIASRFMKYVQGLVEVIGHADRAGPLQDYCTGLVAASGRKSVEPMAAITAPERTAAQHQSLLHFVGQGAWSDDAVLAKVREMVLPEIERHGAIKAWIIDDTSFPKRALGWGCASILRATRQTGIMFGSNLCSVANIGHIYHLTIRSPCTT